MNPENTRQILQIIGRHIHHIRESKKISLESASKLSGLTIGQIKALEEGKWDAPHEILVALAEGLSVQPKDLWPADTDFGSLLHR